MSPGLSWVIERLLWQQPAAGEDSTRKEPTGRREEVGRERRRVMTFPQSPRPPVRPLRDGLVERPGAAREEDDGDRQQRCHVVPEVAEGGTADDDAARDRDEVRRG